MLFLLSPAKALDFETPAHSASHSQPQFVAQAAELVAQLRALAPHELAELMGLSDKLAALNAARFQAWQPVFTPANAKQALLAFDGDVYDGLQARTLSEADLQWAQQHLCILSGLYGVLRPLDLMQPYRLEMGTRLATARGKNLVQYWGRQISDYLNQRASTDPVPLVVNLASEEYFKAVNASALQPRVVQCVFEQLHGGRYRVMGFAAKRARGLMMRHAIDCRAISLEQLKAFNAEGYRFVASESGPDRLVFRLPA
ncbi:MAG: peroxide stress protein YaaA [Betaproteobacteria bacterium]|nr:peroxide stress protein YaaA [Betaproteobacteria bacterium]